MKSISAYLVQIRTAAIKSDIKITGWRIYTVSLIVFLIGLMLENVFYLSPFIRYTSLLILGSFLLVFGLWILAIIYQICQLMSVWEKLLYYLPCWGALIPLPLLQQHWGISHRL